MTLLALGPGVTYYAASNWYFSFALSLSRLSVDDSSNDALSSDWGVGGSIGFGREWWVSPQLGLGFGAFLFAGRTPTDDGADGIANATFGLSASFN
jgi:hypothetical protein